VVRRTRHHRFHRGPPHIPKIAFSPGQPPSPSTRSLLRPASEPASTQLAEDLAVVVRRVRDQRRGRDARPLPVTRSGDTGLGIRRRPVKPARPAISAPLNSLVARGTAARLRRRSAAANRGFGTSRSFSIPYVRRALAGIVHLLPRGADLVLRGTRVRRSVGERLTRQLEALLRRKPE
jgi:hypothetical protein